MRYLEDFAVGQTFGSGRIKVEEQRIQNGEPVQISVGNLLVPRRPAKP